MAFKKVNLFLQTVVLLSLIAWQCYRLPMQEKVSLEDVYKIEHSRLQWPYVVAATIFLMEFMMCFVLILLLRLMLHFKDPGSGEVLFLVRLREVAEMLAIISFFSGVFYVYVTCRQLDKPLPMGRGSLFAHGHEVREGRHLLLWTLLAPQQWVMHARLYTKASVEATAHIMMSTAYMLIFAAIGANTDMTQTDTLIAPHWRVRFFTALSFFCLLTTFVRAHRLPMEPAIAKTGGFYLKVKYVVWSAYPVAYLLSSLGFISPWMEEVMLYTCLDVIAKSLSLIASSTGPLFTLFVSTWGHWHVSGGLHDIRVNVSEPTWSVQSVEMDESAETGETITGLTAGRNFLREAVENTEERRRLVQVAKQVDGQLSFMAQKTPLTVTLAGGTQVAAECYVSRSLWGCRQLAITLVSFPGMEQPSTETKVHEGDDDTRSPLESPRSQGSAESQSNSYGRFTVSSRQATSSQVRNLTPAKVALHQYLTQKEQRSASAGESVEDPYWQTRTSHDLERAGC